MKRYNDLRDDYRQENLREEDTVRRMTGTIVKVRLNQGFAFLRGVEDGLSRFVYSRDVVPLSAFDTMHEGQRVTFEPAGVLDESPDAKNNGLRAINVRVE